MRLSGYSTYGSFIEKLDGDADGARHFAVRHARLYEKIYELYRLLRVVVGAGEMLQREVAKSGKPCRARRGRSQRNLRDSLKSIRVYKSKRT